MWAQGQRTARLAPERQRRQVEAMPVPAALFTKIGVDLGVLAAVLWIARSHRMAAWIRHSAGIQSMRCPQNAVR